MIPSKLIFSWQMKPLILLPAVQDHGWIHKGLISRHAIIQNYDCFVRHKAIECILLLLRWVNEQPEEKFNHVGLRKVVV